MPENIAKPHRIVLLKRRKPGVGFRIQVPVSCVVTMGNYGEGSCVVFLYHKLCKNNQLKKYEF